MKLLLLTILLLASPVMAQNRSFDPLRLRLAEKHIDELEKEIVSARLAIAEMKATQAANDKWIYGALGLGALGTGGGAVALRRRKQD